MQALHQWLLSGDEIRSKAADDYFADLGRRMKADVNPEPQVVLTGDATDGTTIRIVECVALGATDEAPLLRGYLWVATTGTMTLYPSYREKNGDVVPGRILGNHVALSTKSAGDALDKARSKLNSRRQVSA